MDGWLPVFSTLLSFLPTVVLLLTVVSLFEHGGFTLAFGCTTLAVANMERTDPARERALARFMTFVPCTAKLPVLMFLCGVILSWTAWGVAFLYIFAVFVAMIFGGGAVQIPKFRPISISNLTKSIAINVLQFLKRISAGLVLAVTALYTLQYFGLLVPIAAIVAPMFAPIGLDTPAIVIALLFGLVAKEMIIGVILSFGVGAIALTTPCALSFAVFVLLYTPCLPALTALRARFGFAFAARTAVFNFTFAYAVAFVAYMTAVLLTI